MAHTCVIEEGVIITNLQGMNRSLSYNPTSVEQPAPNMFSVEAY